MRTGNNIHQPELMSRAGLRMYAVGSLFLACILQGPHSFPARYLGTCMVCITIISCKKDLGLWDFLSVSPTNNSPFSGGNICTLHLGLILLVYIMHAILIGKSLQTNVVVQIYS